MCGRFCCAQNPKEVADKLQKDKYCDEDITVDCEDYIPRYNVAPTSNILVFYEKESKKKLQTMNWGYLPSWAKKLPLTKPINARQDTIEKSANYFSSSKNSQRCVIVAEGFFEWKKLNSGKKQPYYIKRKDGKLMAFAGLYDISQLTDKSYTCVIITTNAQKSFSIIHDRMPVILDEKSVLSWVDSSKPWTATISQLMRPFEGELEFYQVSDAVGSTKNDSPRLITSIDSQKSSISHFLKRSDPKEEAVTKSKKRKIEKEAN